MEKLNAATAAILFGVYAALALDVYGTLNSSPQTTELFASDRRDSLMHWVLIGDAVAVGTGLFWSLAAKNPWPLVASATVASGMHFSYVHAVKRGTGQIPPA